MILNKLSAAAAAAKDAPCSWLLSGWTPHFFWPTIQLPAISYRNAPFWLLTRSVRKKQSKRSSKALRPGYTSEWDVRQLLSHLFKHLKLAAIMFSDQITGATSQLNTLLWLNACYYYHRPQSHGWCFFFLCTLLGISGLESIHCRLPERSRLGLSIAAHHTPLATNNVQALSKYSPC